MFLVALTTFLVGASAHSTAAATNQVEVFFTGHEQTVISRFTRETDRTVPGPFSNSLDHAFAVLLAKAYPKPDVTRLAQATIASLCEAIQRETGSKISTAQQGSWVSQVSQTKSLDSVLRELATITPDRFVRNRCLDAALNGMLKATGWDFACVLPQAQANDMKRLLKAREIPSAERGILGLRLDRWPVVQVVPGDPAAEAGLRNGDVVVAADGQPVTHLKTGRDALTLLHGPAGRSVKLAVQRGDKTLIFEVTRAGAGAAAVNARQLGTNVLLIRIPTFEGAGISARVKRLIEDQAKDRARVIVFDLRNNPGGRPEEANGVADVFLDGKTLMICEFRNGTRIAFKSNPGAVAARVILLTNRNTGSAAEVLAMALHDNGRGLIVGENTAGALFGKDGAELASGQMIMFRTEPTLLSPAGHDYSLTGIPPDVRVRNARTKGKDAILNRALALAREPGTLK